VLARVICQGRSPRCWSGRARRSSRLRRSSDTRLLPVCATTPECSPSTTLRSAGTPFSPSPRPACVLRVSEARTEAKVNRQEMALVSGVGDPGLELGNRGDV